MKQDNPFAKLGALDQKLYQETAIKKDENFLKNQENESASTSTISVPKKEVKKEIEQNKHDTMIPRHHDTMTPLSRDTMTPKGQSDIIEVVRKAAKHIGKEAATHRFTIEEKN